MYSMIWKLKNALKKTKIGKKLNYFSFVFLELIHFLRKKVKLKKENQFPVMIFIIKLFYI